MRVVIGLFALLGALVLAGCGSPTPAPSPSAASPSAFTSPAALRARLTSAWSEAPQSLRKDLIGLPGAATCDVYAPDPDGSAKSSDGTRRSKTLFAVYPSPPDPQVLSRADQRVYWRSAYGDPLYRLSGANWAIWSASRSTLIEFQRKVGGELVLVHESGEPVSFSGGSTVRRDAT